MGLTFLFQAITTVTEGKNTLGFDEEGGELPSTAQTKKRKRGKGGDGGSRGGGVVMLPHFKSADVTAIEVKERLFDGVELFVLNGDTTYSKQNVTFQYFSPALFFERPYLVFYHSWR